ncbi:hypothetical protein GCM10029978_096430 [Actinoallomurus acanthiterrae]
MLEDPQNVFSAQNVVPLVYKANLNDTGRTALNAVSAKLTTADLLAMMTKVVGDKQDPSAVAKDWLKQAGLGG